MTIDEAIKNCTDVSEKNRHLANQFRLYDHRAGFNGFQETAQFHEQLAEWLDELKHLRRKVHDQADCIRRYEELQQRREHDVNRAEILRLCNEIEGIATEIREHSETHAMNRAAWHICRKVQAIGKELTGDAGSENGGG